MASVALLIKERDPVKLWARLKDSASEVRGFDVIQSKGKSVRIPRLLNLDVRSLVARWTNEVIIAGAKSSAKDAFSKLVAKWEPAATEMVAQAAAGGPSALFPDPTRFWDATLRLAIGLNSLQVIPGTWNIVWESVSEAVKEAPAVISEYTGKAAKFVGRVVGKVGAGVFEGLGITGLLLIGGGIYYVTRKKGS